MPIAMARNRIHRLKHVWCEEPQASSNAVRVKLATKAMMNAPQYGPDTNVVTNPAEMVSTDSLIGVATI